MAEHWVWLLQNSDLYEVVRQLRAGRSQLVVQWVDGNKRRRWLRILHEFDSTKAAESLKNVQRLRAHWPNFSLLVLWSKMTNLSALDITTNNLQLVVKMLRARPALREVAVRTRSTDWGALAEQLGRLPQLAELTAEVFSGWREVGVARALAQHRPQSKLRKLALSFSDWELHDGEHLLTVVQQWCGWQLRLVRGASGLDVARLMRESPGVAELDMRGWLCPPDLAAELRLRRLAAAQLALVCAGLRAMPRLPPELHQLVFNEFL